MTQKEYPRNPTLHKSQPSHEQALGLDRLLRTAENYLQQLHTERE